MNGFVHIVRTYTPPKVLQSLPSAQAVRCIKITIPVLFLGLARHRGQSIKHTYTMPRIYCGILIQNKVRTRQLCREFSQDPITDETIISQAAAIFEPDENTSTVGFAVSIDVVVLRV